MGEMINLKAGDRCPFCKEGYIKEIIHKYQPGFFESLVDSISLIDCLEGDTIEYECQKCFKKFTNGIYLDGE